jgi:tRNA dimethylallyltransferase
MKQPLIVIAGPTATGKTNLSVALAKKINGEIISADSMQVYKYMDIGTAKVTETEKQNIKHYLVDEFLPDDPFNIHIFQKRAKEAIDEIIGKGKIPILVGGTGFYIQSIIYDIDFEETTQDDSYRKSLELLAKEKGNDYVHQLLQGVDEKAYEKIHPNNIKRVIRALEFYKETGNKISEHNEREMQKESPYNLLFYVLTMDREVLYHRINTRVDLMFQGGLVEEVKGLMARGYEKSLVSMQGLGYKEIIDYLEGSIDLEAASYILKRDTRHFAKRQLTWFRREKNVEWLNITEYNYQIENILEKIIKDIEKFNILL